MDDLDNNQQYTVVLSYNTMGSSPEDALETALAAVADRSAAYVEIFLDGSDVSVSEGELGEYPAPESDAPEADAPAIG